MADNADDKEIVIAGFLRFMIGARLRAKDAAEIRQEPTLDLNEDTGVGYVDVVADKTKTAQGFRGREGTEITAHSWGLVHDTWALDWLNARARLGLHAEADGMLMPSFEVGQQFSATKAANSQEIGIHLREI